MPSPPTIAIFTIFDRSFMPIPSQAARQTQAEFGSDDMDNALAGLIDIEHPDAAGRSLRPQRRQQFQSDLVVPALPYAVQMA